MKALATLAKQELNTLTQDKVELIKQTIMPLGSTNSQLELFIHVCNRTGLDPLARQIYAMTSGGKMSIITGIDGLRLIAQRTGEYAGQVGPFWCGLDGVWKDVWLSKDAPAAAKVGVLRNGFQQALWGVATWDSYGKQNAVWKQYPDVMLAKVAESLALRRSFPAEMSGVHAKEEMVTDPKPVRVLTPEQASRTYQNSDKEKQRVAEILFSLDVTDYDDAKFDDMCASLVGTPVGEVVAKVTAMCGGVVNA